MPASTTSPIKIISDLGYDPVDIESDEDYLRALMEAVNKLSIDSLSNPGRSDERIVILQDEVRRVRAQRKAAAPSEGMKFTEKRTRLDPNKIMGRSDLSSGLESSSEEGGKENVINFLNGEVTNRLDNIGDDLEEIKGLLTSQNKSVDDQYEEMRQAVNAARKKKREEDLENKDKKPGGGLKDKALEMVTKPAGNFFSKIIKFLTYTFLGGVVNRIISIIKDPAQLLDPIKKFFNFIIGMMNSVMKGLWTITGAPINFIIEGINAGTKWIIDGINTVLDKIPLLDIKSITPPQIPLIPGPPQVPEIPLSRTAQAAEEVKSQGLSEGGVVQNISGDKGETGEPGAPGQPGETVDAKDISAEEGGEVTPQSGITINNMGADTQLLAAKPGEQVVTPEGVQLQKQETGTEPIDFNVGPKANQPTLHKDTGIVAASRGGEISPVVAASTGGEIGAKVQPRTPFSPPITRLSVGGVVPAPYPATNVLGTSHNVLNVAPRNIMGYKRGGDVIKANLTPGEIVMNKEQQQRIMRDTGVNPASYVPKAKIGKVNFASGGRVGYDIPTPNKKGGGLIVLGGKKGGRSLSAGASPPPAEGTPKFSSFDPHNASMPAIKSLYNIMG